MIETDTLVVTLGTTTTQLPAVTGCTIRFDEGATPYGTGSITIEMPSLAILAQLDPRDRPAIRIVAERRPPIATGTVAPTSTLSTSMRVVNRSIDLRAGTVTLALANDEAFLDFAPAADIDYGQYYTNARLAVRDAVRASLPAGTQVLMNLTPATPFAPAFTARNLVPEGGFEWPLTGRWKPVNANVSIVRGMAKQGTNSMKLTANTFLALDSYVEIDPGFTPGKTYRVTAWGMHDFVSGRVVMPGRNEKLCVVADPRGFPEIIAISPDWQTPFNKTTPVERVIEFTMPDNIKDSNLRLYNGTDNQTQGSIYWDAVTVMELPFYERPNVPITYFDGDTPDDDTYVYTWDATEGVSSSTRTPRVERRPDSLVWKRGQTARDFITSILQPLGFRLFQDPFANWRIVDNSYINPNNVFRFEQMLNLYQGTEEAGFNETHPDGSPLWADAVAITYRWLDGEGVQQERIDTYAPEGYRKLYSMTLDNTPYPGPGQAKYVQSRLVMRSRQMATTGRVNFNTIPSAEVTLAVPHLAELQTGFIDSVAFDITGDEMTVVSKALVDTPATAWNQLRPSQQRWADSPVGASWASETA